MPSAQAIERKFREMYEDLEANVTKIYRRYDLMTAFDLVAHSVLQFRFQGDLLRRGWVEGLVVGDTRCGKSETQERLVNHYRAGEVVTGENATYAGLIGGMQQTQKTWSITWGKFPLNDRRMLIIDELSGLPQEAISRMSGVRSSGVAEIIKIQTERTLARVRSLWSSNPRGKRPLAAFNSGIDAVVDLIGHPEDIARFDFALTVASAEVPLDIINSRERPKVTHKYTSLHCPKLIQWVWSRRPDQVEFARGAEDACLTAATELSKRYVPPLVEGAEQRVKVARLAVATAARVFSRSPDGQRVVVHPGHVEFVVRFLDSIYSKPSMAFDAHSRTKLAEQELPNRDEVYKKLSELGIDFRRLIMDAPVFSVVDLQDFGSLTREDAQTLVSFLVRKRCAKKGRAGYYKTPPFIRMLRSFGDAVDEYKSDDGGDEAPF